MARGKMIYLSDEAHQRLRILAARRKRSMGRLVEELVEREAEDLANVWLSAGGLRLQEQALAEVWDDPALDVYNDA